MFAQHGGVLPVSSRTCFTGLQAIGAVQHTTLRCVVRYGPSHHLTWLELSLQSTRLGGRTCLAKPGKALKTCLDLSVPDTTCLARTPLQAGATKLLIIMITLADSQHGICKCLHT